MNKSTLSLILQLKLSLITIVFLICQLITSLSVGCFAEEKSSSKCSCSCTSDDIKANTAGSVNRVRAEIMPVATRVCADYCELEPEEGRRQRIATQPRTFCAMSHAARTRPCLRLLRESH